MGKAVFRRVNDFSGIKGIQGVFNRNGEKSEAWTAKFAKFCLGFEMYNLEHRTTAMGWPTWESFEKPMLSSRGGMVLVKRRRGDPFERWIFYKTDFFDHACGVTCGAHHVTFGSFRRRSLSYSVTGGMTCLILERLLLCNRIDS